MIAAMSASRPSSIRCTISDCWSTRAAPWNKPPRWPAGSYPMALRICGRLLEQRLNKHGRREYIQVLRLLETFALEEVSAAIDDALRMNTISFDAVRHLVLCRVERKPPRLDLKNWPHLPLPRVRTTAAADYMTLLSGRAFAPALLNGEATS
jgi:hypothetical protein